jgi:hypothetical protein
MPVENPNVRWMKATSLSIVLGIPEEVQGNTFSVIIGRTSKYHSQKTYCIIRHETKIKNTPNNENGS